MDMTFSKFLEGLITLIKKISDEDIGDSFEDFLRLKHHELLIRKGALLATIYTICQVAIMVTSLLNSKTQWSLIMFTNHLKMALRCIKKYKAFSIINIIGLVIGLACFILILLYVKFEMSYDRYHDHAHGIHRVLVEIEYSNRTGNDITNCTPFPLKTAMEQDFPEVVQAARVLNFSGAVKHNQTVFFEKRMYMADPEFLTMFSFPLISGDKRDVLNDPSSVVMTRQTAEKYFGQIDPIGKMVQINGRPHTVTGILETIPRNSHFTFDILVPIINVTNTAWGRHHWTFFESLHGPTYIQLQENVNANGFKDKLPAFFKKHAGEKINYNLLLQPLTDIHLYGKYSSELELNSDIRVVSTFAVTGFLILLIACFNYINLTTARSEIRAKEVGIRKVVGAHRKNIASQFFMESMFFSLFAFVLTLPLVQLALPAFSDMVGRKLDFRLMFIPSNLFTILGVVLLVGILSGSYPSFYLSAFHPLKVIKGLKEGRRNKRTIFRNTLVVCQFVISVALIICTLVITQQLKYINDRDLGYEKDQIISVTIRDSELRKNLDAMVNTLKRNPSIRNVCYQERLPSDIRQLGSFRFEGMTASDQVKTYVNFVEHNFTDFYGINMVDGRGFSTENKADTNPVALINQTAARAIRYNEPIGKTVSVWGREYTIAGVMEDFNFLPLHQAMSPLIVGLSHPSFLKGLGFQCGFLSLKIDSKNIRETIVFAEEIFKSFSPDYAFEFEFFDDRIGKMYAEDNKTGKTFSRFSLIAILIACMGLLGLAMFTTARRTKEIGIRKVLGASSAELFVLISKDLTKWILISNIIAWPIAYLVMNRWLQSFAFRIDLGVGVFLISTALSFMIALFTVSHQSFRTAYANPVNSLRDE